jgi:uncharacterized protein YggU (UPF0235/DUF167 family)
MRILRIKVKPNARATSLEARDDGTWLARVNAPPVDGRANAALTALVAEHFGVPRSRVSIRGGAAGRMKTVAIDD